MYRAGVAGVGKGASDDVGGPGGMEGGVDGCDGDGSGMKFSAEDYKGRQSFGAKTCSSTLAPAGEGLNRGVSACD